MARYFFDLINGSGTMTDDQGQEFASRETVQKEVLHMLPDIARDELAGKDRQVFTVKVRDETGHYIFEASLSWKADWLD